MTQEKKKKKKKKKKTFNMTDLYINYTLVAYLDKKLFKTK
jgi:hypothetical protein